MRKLLTLAAAVALTGCVSMGTNYDVAAVDQLRIGMTQSEVIQLLGPPNQIINHSDGTQRLVWVHSTGSMLGATARSVGLPFGADATLIDVPPRDK